MIDQPAATRLLILAQAFDNRTIGEANVTAWQDALGDLHPADCAEAIRSHYRSTSQMIMPADVRKHAIAASNDRHQREIASSYANGDPRPEWERVSAHNAYEAAAADLASVLAAKHKTDPDLAPSASENETAARKIACTWCHAPVGSPCTQAGRGSVRVARTLSHPSRYEATAADPAALYSGPQEREDRLSQTVEA